MLLPKECQIWKLADDGRHPLDHIAFDAAAAVLRVTDGKALAVIPCEVEDGDESGLIPAAAFKEAARLGGKREANLRLTVKEGKATLTDGRSFPLLTGHNFPPFDAAAPRPKTWGRDRATIMLNAELLAVLAAAIGAAGPRGVRLSFALDGDGFARSQAVYVDAGKATMAAIMPMRGADSRYQDPEAARAAAEQEDSARTAEKAQAGA